MTKKSVRLFYRIILSIMICVCGILLIVTCVDLYDFQAGSFSRESVAAALYDIRYSMFGCLAMVIAGFLIDGFTRPEEKQKPEKQYETILKNLRKKLDTTKCEPKLAKAIRKKSIWRMVFQILTLIVLVFCSFLFLLYCSLEKHFPADANVAVLQAMPMFFTCLGIPFCCAIFTVYHRRFSIRKEIELVKQALENGAKGELQAPEKVKKQTGVIIARYGILAVALAVLIAGFCFGGTADVLAKAAAICTECVGLG